MDPFAFALKQRRTIYPGSLGASLIFGKSDW
jgi:hypothetical protein